MTSENHSHPFVHDERLRKVERLRQRAQFLHTQRRGRRARSERLTAYVLPNELGYSRLGITTSRKVGKAVIRNRWKRLLRESFRRHKPSFPVGFDVVVIVGPKQAPTTMSDVFEEFSALAHKATRASPSSGRRRKRSR